MLLILFTISCAMMLGSELTSIYHGLRNITFQEICLVCILSVNTVVGMLALLFTTYKSNK